METLGLKPMIHLALDKHSKADGTIKILVLSLFTSSFGWDQLLNNKSSKIGKISLK